MNRLVISLLFAGAACFAAPNPPPGGANGAPPSGRPPQGESHAQNGGRSTGRTSPTAGKTSSRRRKASVSSRSHASDLSDADQKLVDQIGEAESLDALSRLSRRAASSRSADVRMAMVDALESQGERAVNEIAAYIVDSDEDVADSALTAWTDLLQDMSRAKRVQAIRAAAQVMEMAVSMQMRGGDRRQGYGTMQGPGQYQGRGQMQGPGQYQGHGQMQGPGGQQGPGGARRGDR